MQLQLSEKNLLINIYKIIQLQNEIKIVDNLQYICESGLFDICNNFFQFII